VAVVVTSRTEQLAANLRTVRGQIDAACADAGRDPSSVTLVAVTKTWPVEDVRALASLGVTELGENRQSELTAKSADARDLPIRWHFVGQLQANKARAVAAAAAVVHSVDRERLVAALSAGAVAAGRTLDALVQVSLDGDTARGGAPRAAVEDLAAAIEAAPGLRVAGVMAVPPLGADALASYRQLVDIADGVRAHHPTATTISAGMSDDFADAIRAGSTLVRVGTALLGGRPPFVG
jgi:pyridoxal phosphate enzyme (YggS family)